MMIFRTFIEVVMVLVTMPLSLAGGFWLMWALDFQMSVGGVFTVWVVALLVMPALYYLWHRRGLPHPPERKTTDERG